MGESTCPAVPQLSPKVSPTTRSRRSVRHSTSLTPMAPAPSTPRSSRSPCIFFFFFFFFFFTSKGKVYKVYPVFVYVFGSRQPPPACVVLSYKAGGPSLVELLGDLLQLRPQLLSKVVGDVVVVPIVFPPLGVREALLFFVPLFGLELLEVVVLLEGNLLRHVLVLVHLHRRHDDALLSSSPLALPRFSSPC